MHILFLEQNVPRWELSPWHATTQTARRSYWRKCTNAPHMVSLSPAAVLIAHRATKRGRWESVITHQCCLLLLPRPLVLLLLHLLLLLLRQGFTSFPHFLHCVSSPSSVLTCWASVSLRVSFSSPCPSFAQWWHHRAVSGMQPVYSAALCFSRNQRHTHAHTHSALTLSLSLCLFFFFPLLDLLSLLLRPRKTLRSSCSASNVSHTFAGVPCFPPPYSLLLFLVWFNTVSSNSWPGICLHFPNK